MTPYPLPASLDTAAATALHGELLARLDTRQPLIFDAAGVERVGQAGLQLLAGARAAAMTQRLDYAVRAPSATLTEMARLAGLTTLLEPLD